MKFFRILSRNIRDSFRSVFRNFALSIASISCITITLIVVAVAIILSYNVNSFATNVEKDVTIVTFLDVDITPEETDDVEDQINNLDYIETYRYESKKKIAEDMMNSSEVFTNIMKDWDEEESPIQSTFLVKVTNIDKISEVAQKINAIENVSTVKYGEGMIEQLVSVFEIIKQVSIGTVIALILVTAFLISNTIKITIFSRKREIEIMRLVGASNINIKIPFIFEGLFLGILGSVIPIVATVYGYVSLYKNFNGQLFSPFIKLLSPQPFVFSISGVLILIGVAVGMFGSWRAVKKHLSI
jgi:cell division transport system permease protein